MRMVVIGATGNIGSRIVAEAVARGHAVVGTSRDPARLADRAGLEPVALDAGDADRLAAVIGAADAAVFAVKWTEHDIGRVIDAAKRSGIPRALFVVGAGSLVREDGRLHLAHMQDQGITPPTSKAALEALQALRASDGLDWTAASPPADIHPGKRTGAFVLGMDEMPRPTAGHAIARISREDFAVAIVDELESPQFRGRRFTAAN